MRDVAQHVVVLHKGIDTLDAKREADARIVFLRAVEIAHHAVIVASAKKRPIVFALFRDRVDLEDDLAVII